MQLLFIVKISFKNSYNPLWNVHIMHSECDLYDSPDSSAFSGMSLVSVCAVGGVAGRSSLLAWTSSLSVSSHVAACGWVSLVASRLAGLVPSRRRSLSARPNKPPSGARDLIRGLFGGCLGDSASAGTSSSVAAFSGPVVGTTGSSLRLVPLPNRANTFVSPRPSRLLPLSSVLISVLGLTSPKAEGWPKFVPPNRGVAWGWVPLAEKLKDDGVVGWVVDAWALELEGAAGCEKVNCNWVLEGLLLLPVVSGLFWAEIEGAAAGWEKLKPSCRENPVVVAVPLFMVLALVWDPLLPKGELDIEVVWGLAGSGLALKMGLNSASLAGLKLNLVDPKPLLCWVTFWPVPNTLVAVLVDVGWPNTDCPKPNGWGGPKAAVEAEDIWEFPNPEGCWPYAGGCLPNPWGCWLNPGACPNAEGCPNAGVCPKTELWLGALVCPKADAVVLPKPVVPIANDCCPNAGAWLAAGSEGGWADDCPKAGVCPKMVPPWAEGCPNAEGW